MNINTIDYELIIREVEKFIDNEDLKVKFIHDKVKELLRIPITNSLIIKEIIFVNDVISILCELSPKIKSFYKPLNQLAYNGSK